MDFQRSRQLQLFEIGSLWIGDVHAGRKIDGNHHAGNKMALNNIRERLQLHFDAEASLRTSIDNNAYQVHIVMPYRSSAA